VKPAPAGRHLDRIACGLRRGSLKPLITADALQRPISMSAILMILAFIGVIFALNLIEFGRLD
jgi:hypothetical protein